MKQKVTLCLTGVVLLMLASVAGAQQEPRRPRSPVLTNEDVTSPASPRSNPDDSVSRNDSSGSTIGDPRGVLEGAVAKLGEVKSIRTRMKTSLPSGEREVLIESVKPDRMRVTSSDVEFIMIGRKFYLKTDGKWQVTSAPADSSQSDTGLDFRAFLKQMLAKPGVLVTGRLVGDQTIDGVDTTAYDFTVSTESETATIQLWIGKQDGYMRRLFLSGGAMGIRIWFSNINETLSIKPPM